MNRTWTTTSIAVLAAALIAGTAHAQSRTKPSAVKKNAAAQSAAAPAQTPDRNASSPAPATVERHRAPHRAGRLRVERIHSDHQATPAPVAGHDAAQVAATTQAERWSARWVRMSRLREKALRDGDHEKLRVLERYAQILKAHQPAAECAPQSVDCGVKSGVDCGVTVTGGPVVSRPAPVTDAAEMQRRALARVMHQSERRMAIRQARAEARERALRIGSGSTVKYRPYSERRHQRLAAEAERNARERANEMRPQGHRPPITMSGTSKPKAKPKRQSRPGQSTDGRR